MDIRERSDFHSKEFFKLLNRFRKVLLNPMMLSIF
jgi:hypothetical protein